MAHQRTWFKWHMNASLHVYDTALGIQHALMHRFRKCGMREDRVHQFLFSGFETHGDYKALDKFGDFGAYHMGAQQPSGLGIENRLNQSLILAKGNGFAVADEGKAADLEF